MKRILSLTLVLLMLLPIAFSALPQLSFAEAIQLVETTDGYDGSVYYSKGIRKKSDGSILFCPYLSQLRAKVDAKEADLGDYTMEMTFIQLSEENGEAVHTFDTVHAAINSSNGFYQDVYLNGAKGNCGFCPTAGSYYNVDVKIYENYGKTGQTLSYYGTYKNAYADPSISSSTYYNPTPSGSEPTDYTVSLSYSFNNDLKGSAAGTVILTVDKAGQFEIRWADGNGQPLTAKVGQKTLTYSPLFEITASKSGSYSEELIDFTAIPQGAKKLIVTDSGSNVLKSIDLPAAKLLDDKSYNYSFGAISDLHYEYFFDKTTGADWAIYCVDTAVDFYEAVGANLIVATGDYSLYREESAYQKYQAAMKKSTIPVLACGGNHEVYAGFKVEEMYGKDGYWRKYMNNGVYDGTLEGVLNVAENGIDFAYSYPGLEDYVYLSLSQWYWDGHTEGQECLITDDQLSWLEKQLEAYKDKTVYLLFHTYLGDDDYETLDGQGDMVSGGGYTYGGFWNKHAKDESVFRSLLEKYDNVVWFNGHSHYDYSAQRYNENLNIFDYYGTTATMIHVPSVTNMRSVSDTSAGYGSMYGTASQGALMFVYDGYQIMNGVDLWGEEILSYACYIVYDDKTETGTVSGTDITYTYDKQLCSLRFDGTGTLNADKSYQKYANEALTVYVGKGITSVGKEAFKGFTKLKNVSLKDDVATVGQNAFENTAIESLTLPEGLKKVEKDAFKGVTTPVSVIYYGTTQQWPKVSVEGTQTALKNAAISVRKYLVTFLIDGQSTITEWKDRTVPFYDGRPSKTDDTDKLYLFKGWSDGTKTYVPGEALPKATKDVTYTAVFKESKEQRIVSGSVAKIEWSLDRATGILTISGKGATPNWTGTTKGEWHKYSTEIYEVVVEKGVAVIGTFAFSKMPSLNKITLPEGIVSLSADAFSYNPNLKTIVLPSTIKTVGQGVTFGTENVESIYYTGCPDGWGALMQSINSLYNDGLKGALPIFSHKFTPGYVCTNKNHTPGCAICGYKVGEAEAHVFGEDWVVTIEPQPGVEGEKAIVCETCGHKKETQKLEALPLPSPSEPSEPSLQEPTPEGSDPVATSPDEPSQNGSDESPAPDLKPLLFAVIGIAAAAVIAVAVVLIVKKNKKK